MKLTGCHKAFIITFHTRRRQTERVTNEFEEYGIGESGNRIRNRGARKRGAEAATNKQAHKQSAKNRKNE